MQGGCTGNLFRQSPGTEAHRITYEGARCRIYRHHANGPSGADEVVGSNGRAICVVTWLSYCVEGIRCRDFRTSVTRYLTPDSLWGHALGEEGVSHNLRC